ncbi:MAG: hypothetical protein JNL79_14305 [Myxococcales bacterium]|nr:hypothetical protein [Myxococcales bacterium]
MQRTVPYVFIDRPEDADLAAHQPNIDGLAAAVAAFDDQLTVLPVHIRELVDLDAHAFVRRFHPFAVFGAGSFTEWFQYGADPAWRAVVDPYLALLRTLRTPMLAVCGSHQLLAAAVHGFSAIAHMNDAGDPVRISDELATDPPAPRFPDPRVGEVGTYPIALTAAGARDGLASTFAGEPLWASLHHKDMVVDTRRARLLFTHDDSREPRTNAGELAQRRCAVQGLHYKGRPMWSTQFHPEIGCFSEGTSDDGGFGRRFLVAFLHAARRHHA